MYGTGRNLSLFIKVLFDLLSLGEKFVLLSFSLVFFHLLLSCGGVGGGQRITFLTRGRNDDADFTACSWQHADGDDGAGVGGAAAAAVADGVGGAAVVADGGAGGAADDDGVGAAAAAVDDGDAVVVVVAADVAGQSRPHGCWQSQC